MSHFSYAICIRKELGFCCIEYKTCSDTGAFSIDTQDAGTETGSNCALDFLEISGGAGSCGSTVLTNRFCGAVFSAVHDSDVTGTVCGTYSKRKNSLYIYILFYHFPLQIALLHSMCNLFQMLLE